MTENKGDLISREALKEEIIQYFNDVMDINEIKTVNTVISLIDNAPTVEISQEQAIDKLNEIGWLYNHDKAIAEYVRPQGEWITKFDSLECPFCGMSIDDEVHWLYSNEFNFNFCPNCGADMKGGEE